MEDFEYSEKLKPIIDEGISLAFKVLPNLALAIITLLVGLWLISLTIRLITRLMKKRNVDPSLQPFLRSLINIGLKTLLLISVAGMVGIKTTSFVAVLGAAGLAVGLALQGSLANFAGGALIIMFRPFKVGDVIEAQGFTGSVESISIFTTHLLTVDNKSVIIPNGPLANGSIVNYTEKELRRVDVNVGIGYNADIKTARGIALQLMQENELVLQDPAPAVAILGLGDSSVDLQLRAWAKTTDYWTVKDALLEGIKYAYDQHSIEIPFPQMQIHNPAK